MHFHFWDIFAQYDIRTNGHYIISMNNFKLLTHLLNEPPVIHKLSGRTLEPGKTLTPWESETYSWNNQFHMMPVTLIWMDKHTKFP